MPAAPSCHVDVSGCNVWNKCCRCCPLTFFFVTTSMRPQLEPFLLCLVQSTRICCNLLLFSVLLFWLISLSFSHPLSVNCLPLWPVRACAGGVSTVLCWTAVLSHTGFLSCMNRYLIHSSLISGPPCSAHFAPCHPKCCWLLRFTCVVYTCILSCTSMTTVIFGQCQSSYGSVC